MHPMSHDYHQAQVERLRSAFSLFASPAQPTAPAMYVAKDQPIFGDYESEQQSYLVTSGEVLILRNGRPVELLERGEIFDPSLWPGTTAMALHNCTLAIRPSLVFSKLR